MFAGATPWDSVNFNPATKADLNSSVVFSLVTSTAAGGDVGGRYVLAKPTANTSTLSNDVVIDVQNNTLRVYENATPFRGVTVDLTGAGSQSNLWHSGNFTPSNYAPITAPSINNSLNVVAAGGGRVSLSAGSAANDGYVAFINKDGVRSGYIGWSNGGNVAMQTENGNKFNFNVNPTVNGSGVWHAGNFDPATKLDVAGGSIATGTLGFGSTVRQMINLWGTGYGIGVQSNTWYARTTSEFAVHLNGVHSNTQGDPGTGGTNLMRLSSTLFTYKGSNIWHAGNFDPGTKLNAANPVFTGGLTGPTINISNGSNGNNWFTAGNGDAANYTTTNARLRIHWGLGMESFDGTVNGYWDSRAGVWDTKGVPRVNGSNVWYPGNFDPNTKANLTGATFTGDITTYRAGSPTTGVIYLGNSGARYLFYNGSGYYMPDAELYVNGSQVARNGTAPRFSAMSLGTGGGYLYSDVNADNVILRTGDGSSGKPYRYLAVQADTVRTYNAGIYVEGVLRTNNQLTVGEGQTNSFINMWDSDEGNRSIHCNSGHIGFLNRAGGWSFQSNNDGNIWTPYFGYLSDQFNARLNKNSGAGRQDVNNDILILKGEPRLKLDWSGIGGHAILSNSDNRFYIQKETGYSFQSNLLSIGTGGDVWTAQFGDLNSRIEDRAFAWAADRANFRVAKTGDTMTGALWLNYANPELRLHYTGVMSGRLWMGNDAVLRWSNGDSGAEYFRFHLDGQLWSPLYGYLSQYITDRINNKSVRLAYAGDLDNNWNYGGGYEEPYGGGVVTSRQIVYTPAGIVWGGGRWRYVQCSTADAVWYTVGYV